MRSRNINLDMLRFFSAIIVFSGHLLYGIDHQIPLEFQNRFTAITRLGSFFVLVFFFLSGIALRYQTQKYGVRIRWIIARIVRLMPVYWATLSLSLLGAHYFGANIKYPFHGFVLTFLGIESLIPALTIPPGNPPLWSLSIELILSVSLLILARPFMIRFRAIFLCLLPILVFCYPSQGLFVAFIFFYTGFTIANIEFRIRITRVLLAPIFILGVFVLFFFSKEFLSLISGNLGFVTSYLLVGSLVIPLLAFRSVRFGILAKFSERSYSLYAVHFPVITAVDSIFFKNFDNLTISQSILSLFLVALSTEVVFRLIERPTLQLSREILKDRFKSR
jgi:peptidoglycan/LPS O-acetylase OafA/YrhL